VDAQQQGRANVYIIVWDGRKITFRPLQEVENSTHFKGKPVLLSTGLEFIEEVKEARDIIAMRTEGTPGSVSTRSSRDNAINVRRIPRHHA
jgi:hypothetical protein